MTSRMISREVMRLIGRHRWQHWICHDEDDEDETSITVSAYAPSARRSR